MARKRSHRPKAPSFSMSPQNFMDKLSYEVKQLLEKKLRKIVCSYADENSVDLNGYDLLDQPISRKFIPLRDQGNEFDTVDETYQDVYGVIGNRVMELDIERKRLFLTQSGEQIEEEGESLQKFLEDTGMCLDTVLVVTRTVRRISTWESEVDFSFELYNGILEISTY